MTSAPRTRARRLRKLIRQIEDFRHGRALHRGPAKPNTNTMIAKAMSETEIKDFSSRSG